jgi:hypothetical protein
MYLRLILRRQFHYSAFDFLAEGFAAQSKSVETLSEQNGALCYSIVMTPFSCRPELFGVIAISYVLGGAERSLAGPSVPKKLRVVPNKTQQRQDHRHVAE